MSYERVQLGDHEMDRSQRTQALSHFACQTFSEGPPLTFDGQGKLLPVIADLRSPREIMDINDVPVTWHMPVEVARKYNDWHENWRVRRHEGRLDDRVMPAHDFMLKAWAYSTELDEPFTVKIESETIGVDNSVHRGKITLDDEIQITYWPGVGRRQVLDGSLVNLARNLMLSLGRKSFDRQIVTGHKASFDIPEGQMLTVPSSTAKSGAASIELIPQML
jgi:hypothetical protein